MLESFLKLSLLGLHFFLVFIGLKLVKISPCLQLSLVSLFIDFSSIFGSFFPLLFGFLGLFDVFVDLGLGSVLSLFGLIFHLGKEGLSLLLQFSSSLLLFLQECFCLFNFFLSFCFIDR